MTAMCHDLMKGVKANGPRAHCDYTAVGAFKTPHLHLRQKSLIYI